MSESSNRQRVGIFGGTFDPIHLGHLLLAEVAADSLELDEVRFVPAAISPLKTHQRPIDDKHRLEMVRLAIGGNSRFRVDDREIRRGGTSYTVDTLAELRQENPQTEWYFLMGADSLVDFHSWREPERICQLARVIVLSRGGQAAPDMQLLAPYLPESQRADLASHCLTMPQVDVSSSAIRESLRQSRSVRYQLHPAVAAYIQAQQLYR
ncbi:nicotinate-nucleotide adenylyltransferase [Aureliella helgolandensis]|uniref:Probable nicotinate-nucleotide adenylyltransferase n=1 Tax=Aureliella helgolandensis TaxID=2527968 RepID=A0A518GFH1_9BACT|nr:nicotinate-nucleotide adenylyltransferase [Aureliella helgolandensis]QDV27346.1 Nicotinate-nucleotide adenylyltransferase [Aureliella helgolandensis]